MGRSSATKAISAARKVKPPRPVFRSAARTKAGKTEEAISRCDLREREAPDRRSPSATRASRAGSSICHPARAVRASRCARLAASPCLH